LAAHGLLRFLRLAARPLRELQVQRTPFAMNNREEFEQAIENYRLDRLA
jgi:redox-sensitive bicupin YhaK (pirin superfamily)